MRYDQILAKIVPGANYTFAQREIVITSRKPGQEPQEVTEYEYIFDDYDAIIWQDDSEQPTLQQCQQAWQEIVSSREYEEFAKRRREAYPPIQEQLDMMYWDRVNSTDNWKKAVEKVKQDFPKPQES